MRNSVSASVDILLIKKLSLLLTGSRYCRIFNELKIAESGPSRPTEGAQGLLGRFAHCSPTIEVWEHLLIRVA